MAEPPPPPPDPNGPPPHDPNGRPLPQMPTTPMVGQHHVYPHHAASSAKVGPSSQTVYEGQPYHQPSGTQLFPDQQQQHATVHSTPTAHPISGHQLAPSPFINGTGGVPQQAAFSNSRQHNLPSHHRRQLSLPFFGYEDPYSQLYPLAQQQHPHPFQQQQQQQQYLNPQQHPQQQPQYHHQQQHEQHQYAHDYVSLLGTPGRPHHQRQAQPQQARPPIADATTLGVVATAATTCTGATGAATGPTDTTTTTTADSSANADSANAGDDKLLCHLDAPLVGMYKGKKKLIAKYTMVVETKKLPSEIVHEEAKAQVNLIAGKAKPCVERLTSDIEEEGERIQEMEDKHDSNKAVVKINYEEKRDELKRKLDILEKDYDKDVAAMEKNHVRNKEKKKVRLLRKEQALAFANSLIKCADYSAKPIPSTLGPDWHDAPFMILVAIKQTPGHEGWGMLELSIFVGLDTKQRFESVPFLKRLALLDLVHQLDMNEFPNIRKDLDLQAEAKIVVPGYELGQYRYDYNERTAEVHFFVSFGFYMVYGEDEYDALAKLPDKNTKVPKEYDPLTVHDKVETSMTDRIVKVLKMKDSRFKVPDTSPFKQGFSYFDRMATTPASATTDSTLEPTAGSNDKLTSGAVATSEPWSSGGTSGVSEIASAVDESKTAPAVGEIELKQPPSSLVSGPGTADTPPTPAGSPPPEPAPTGGRYKLPDDEESSISDSTPPPAMNDDTEPAVMASSGAGAGEEDPSAEAAKKEQLDQLVAYIKNGHCLNFFRVGLTQQDLPPTVTPDAFELHQLDMATYSGQDLLMRGLLNMLKHKKFPLLTDVDVLGQVRKWYLECLVKGYRQTHPSLEWSADGFGKFQEWAIPRCKNTYCEPDAHLDEQLRGVWMDVDL